LIITGQSNELNQTNSTSIKTISGESNEKVNRSWPWFCNRGLLVYLRRNENEKEKVCLCPPSYYGNRCEYQNERISLTLGLIRAQTNEIYIVLIF